MKKERGKRAQVTIFIIIAIVVIAGVIAWFLIRPGVSSNIPKEFEPAYNYYLSCIESSTLEGAGILGSQGGYIKIPDFVPGSQYMPFSSELDFFGTPVSYWMYVSGNNLLKEQKPTKEMMEAELSQFVEDRLTECDFTDFNLRGYYVDIGSGSVDVKINDLDIDVDVNAPLKLSSENDSVILSKHNVQAKSKLGKFYNLASDFYESEKNQAVLESYGLDVLRLYAPVTGVEMTCSPKIFDFQQIRKDIVSALESNTASLKIRGSYYSDSDNYFVIDSKERIDENVNFVYSGNWPTKIEINGDAFAEPVGMQEGLGILGFCYVPYHLIYDVTYPVLVQFYDEKELFQFPVAVIIEKNQIREISNVGEALVLESGICEYMENDVRVYTYDLDLNPVEANIRFSCLSDGCGVGMTEQKGGEAYLDAKVPTCINGYVQASAEGYAPAKVMISTNEETEANILMKELHDVTLNLGNIPGIVMVSFASEDYSTAVLYPDTKKVQLIDGLYNVTVYVYKDSTLSFPGVTDKKCFSVPKSGVAGLFGVEEEKCYDIEIPEQEISMAVVGGGKSLEYFFEEDLRNANSLNINVPLFGDPSSVEDLQDNYIESEESYLEVSFS